MTKKSNKKLRKKIINDAPSGNMSSKEWDEAISKSAKGSDATITEDVPKKKLTKDKKAV